MNRKYLGDSFDIVKRFWAERLASIAPLVAHPTFIPNDIRADFEKTVGIRVLQMGERPTAAFGLFLDPDTGIPLPSASKTNASVSHAPLLFIASEFDRLNPAYLICFDQSHDRNCGLTKAHQRQTKLVALNTRGLASFYYVSHAPFLFAARNSTSLESVRICLVASGIPESRFELADALAPGLSTVSSRRRLR